MSIVPGSQVGESKVVIDNVQERTWRPSVGFDNLGKTQQAVRNTTWDWKKTTSSAATTSFRSTTLVPCLSGQSQK